MGSDNGEKSDTRKMIDAAIGEFIGMTLFVYIGCAAAINSDGDVNKIALTFGMAIFVLACAIGHHSGGQMNTAVTVGLMITGDVGLVQGVINMVVQLIGAIFGATLLAATIPAHGAGNGLNGGGAGPSSSDRHEFTCTYYSIGSGTGNGCFATNQVADGFHLYNAFIAEFIMTFLLMFVVLETAVSAKSLPGRVFAPLAIGFAVYLGHSVLIPIDGCSINPARSFGAAFVASFRDYDHADKIWNNHWIFWVAPLCGASLAAVICKFWWHRDQDKTPDGADTGTKDIDDCTVEGVEMKMGDDPEAAEPDGAADTGVTGSV